MRTTSIETKKKQSRDTGILTTAALNLLIKPVFLKGSYMTSTFSPGVEC